MSLFTFYPCKADGTSSSFEMLECPDDARALIAARQVLDEHASAVEVVVWQEERRVGSVAQPA